MNFINQLKHRVKESTFIGNFLNIASANLFSQVLLVLALPILTRLYTPAQFGVAALFLTALQLIGSICTWNFDRMIPNANSRISAQILCMYALSCLTLVSTTTFLFIFFDASFLYIWKGTTELGDLLLLLPLAIFAVGFNQIASAWFARETYLFIISRSVVAYTIAYLLIAILGGLSGQVATALVYANVGSVWTQALTIIHFSSFEINRYSLSKKRLAAIGRKNLPHATTVSSVGFINTLSLAAPVFLLAQVYNVEELGAYALMVRLVVAPLGILTKSLSLSFWSRAAELVRENRLLDLHKLYKKVTLIMAIPATFALIACFIGSKAVPEFLGAEWDKSGKVLLAITPYIVGFAIVSPTNHLWVLKRQGFQLIADCTRLGLMVACIQLASRLDWTFTTAVFALSVSSLVGHIILYSIHIILHRKLL